MFVKKLKAKEERDAGTAILSFDVMMSQEAPGQLSFLLRDYTQQPAKSPATITVLPDGFIQVNSKKVKAPNGVWHHVEISFGLGDGPRKVKATIKTAKGASESFEVPMQQPEFHTLTWLGISAGSQSRAVMYVDNVILRVE
jgi:hypothetical protein